MAAIKPKSNMSWDLALHTVISFLTNSSIILVKLNCLICRKWQVFASHYSNDGAGFSCCDLNFYQRPSHIAADVAEQPDQLVTIGQM